MKKFIYIIFFSILLTGCGTINQTAQKKSEEDAKELIRFAKQYIGTPYMTGGTTPKGFDCSGYVQFVYKEMGYSLPRTARAQSTVGSKVRSKEKLQPGDLVFFKGRNAQSKEIGHVGIVTNPNKKGEFEFIHAASTGVRIDKSESSYYKPRYVTARRIIGSPK